MNTHLKTTILAVFLIALLPSLTKAQNERTTTADEAPSSLAQQADSLYQRGKTLYRSGQLLQAAESNRMAIGLAEKMPVPDRYFMRKCYGNAGLALIQAGDFVGSISMLRTAYSLGKETLGEEDRRLLGYRLNIGNALTALGRYEEAIQVIKSLDSVYQRKVQEDPKWEGALWGNRNNLAVAYLEMGNFPEAERAFLRIKEYQEANGEPYSLGLTEYNLGALHLDMNRWKQALFHFRRADLFWKDIPNELNLNRLKISLKQRIARALQAKGKYTHKEVSQVMNEAIALMDSTELAPQEMATNFSNTGIILAGNNELDRAIAVTMRAVNLLEGDTLSEIRLRSLDAIGEYYAQKKEVSEAEKYYQQSSALLNLPTHDLELDQLAHYVRVIELAAYQKQYARVIQFGEAAQKALGWRAFIGEPQRVTSKKAAYLVKVAMNVVVAKSTVAFKVREREKRMVGLRESLQLLRDIDALFLHLQTENWLEEATDWTQITAGDNYGVGIEICHELFRETGDKSLLDLALYFADRTKYWKVYQRRVAQTANVAESDWKWRERGLRKRLDGLERKIALAPTEDNKNLTSLKMTRDEVTAGLYQLLDSVRTATPRGRELYLNEFSFGVPDVQAQLEEEEVVLYFYGDAFRDWIFTITATAIDLRPLPSGFPEKASAFRSAIESPFENNSQPPSSQLRAELEQYANHGKWLREAVFGEQLLTGDRRRFIIVPDGVIEGLPFCALPTAQPGDPFRMEAYPYLIKKHTLSYAYSLALWLRERKRGVGPAGTNEQGTLALFPFAYGDKTAPSFQNANVEYPSLKFTPLPAEREILSLAERPNTEIITYPASIKTAVLNGAERFPVLYVSSHAGIDEVPDTNAYLAFTRPGTYSRSDFLYANEILHYDLPYEMVYLNACSSSGGKTISGEGTYSLSRSFAYAGTRSVVATSWPVDNLTSASISAGFFRGLQAGNSKDVALAEAQREAIREASDPYRSHPFFWAAFRHFGKLAPLRLP